MVKLVKDRPRRLRRNALIRDLVHEVDLRVSQLIQPYFSGGRGEQPGADLGLHGSLSMGG